MSKVHCASRPRYGHCAALLPRPRRVWRATLAALALGLLAGCFGGGDPAPGSLASTSGSSTNGGTTSANPTLLEGAYQGSANGNDFVSLVTPDKHLFALYFLATSLDGVTPPVIFTGSVSAGQDGSASVADLKAFQNTKPQLLNGTATLSNASAAGFQLQSNLSTADGKAVNFQASALATSAQIGGKWLGTWADSATNMTRTSSLLEFDADGRLQSAQFFSLCDRPPLALTLTPASTTAGQPYFVARLAIPKITGCARTEQADVTLNGVALLHATRSGTAAWQMEL
ncbi:MAG: hypothetical protein ACR2I0_05190, partial [Rhodoferax sp.]